jgi:hypothetical protein
MPSTGLRHVLFVVFCGVCAGVACFLKAWWLVVGFSCLACVWLQPWVSCKGWFQRLLKAHLVCDIQVPHRFQSADNTSVLQALGMVLDFWHMQGCLPCVVPQGCQNLRFKCYDTSCPGMCEEALLAQARTQHVSLHGYLGNMASVEVLATLYGCEASKPIDTWAAMVACLKQDKPVLALYASDAYGRFKKWGVRTQGCCVVGVGMLWGVSYVAVLSSMHRDAALRYVPYALFKKCGVRSQGRAAYAVCFEPAKGVDVPKYLA